MLGRSPARGLEHRRRHLARECRCTWAWHGAGFALEAQSITRLEDAVKFQSHQFLQPLRVQRLHHRDSSALKPQGESNSSRWTKTTGSLGFLLLERPEVCTNQSPLICNKALQRQHYLGEGLPDFSDTAASSGSAPRPKPGRLPARLSIALQEKVQLHTQKPGSMKSFTLPLSKSPNAGPTSPSFQKHPN